MNTYQPHNLQMTLILRLKKLKQTDQIHSYVNEFNTLLYPIKNMSEEDKIITFLDGLKAPIKAKVGLDEPKTLNEAKALAVRFETYYGYEWIQEQDILRYEAKYHKIIMQ